MRRTGWVARWCVAIATLAAAVGCGGGGGSGGDAGQSTSPSTLSPADASAIAGTTLGYHEAVVQLAHAGADFLHRSAAASGAAPYSEPCVNGGTADVAPTDNDSNGVIGPGDRIDVDLRACYVPGVNEVASGRLTLVIGRPSEASTLAALLTFQPGFDLAGVAVRGSLNLLSVRTAALWRLRVTPGTADDLAFSFVSEGVSYLERVRSPEIEKAIDYDRARIANSATLAVDSDLFRGRVSLRTEPSASSELNAVPAQGAWQISVPGMAIVLRGDYRFDPLQVKVSVTATQTGRLLSEGLFRWSDIAEGNLWWDPLSVPDIRAGYGTLRHDPPFRRVHAGPSNPVPASASITHVFSQQLDSATIGPYVFYNSNGVRALDIPADHVVNGARVTITPRQQLTHGLTYTVGTAAFPTLVRDVSGRGIQPQTQTVTVRANLAAQVASVPLTGLGGQSMTLDARSSTSTDGPIASYRWTQVSGSPAAISNASAPLTQVVLATPAAAEIVSFELEVRNAAGEYNRKRVEVQSFPNLASQRVLYVRGTGGYVVGTRVALYSAANGAVTVSRNWMEGISLDFVGTDFPNGPYFSFQSGAATAVPLTVGTYENARRFSFANGQPGLDLYGEGRGCNEVTGRFVVHDVAYDASGDVVRLALDFDHGCEGPPTTLFGSIRINSSIPLRE